MFQLRVGILMLSVAMLCGCAAESNDYNGRDVWLQYRKFSMVESTEVAGEYVTAIPVSEQPAAIQMLTDKDWVEINNPVTIQQFGVKPVAGRNAYLVRAVAYLKCGEGKFDVRRDGENNVQITFTCGGKMRSETERRPIVIYLPQAPKQINVIATQS